MSIQIIRQSLETYLAQTPGLNMPIAFENKSFTPPADGSGYVESRLMPADPDDAMLGSAIYIERGIYQVTLCYPEGKGPKDSDSKGDMLRKRFARGTFVEKDGITTNVVGVPALRAGFPSNGIWRVPLSVAWQAEVSNTQ
jgi:hypothetical protein